MVYVKKSFYRFNNISKLVRLKLNNYECLHKRDENWIRVFRRLQKLLFKCSKDKEIPRHIVICNCNRILWCILRV